MTLGPPEGPWPGPLPESKVRKCPDGHGDLELVTNPDDPSQAAELYIEGLPARPQPGRVFNITEWGYTVFMYRCPTCGYIQFYDTNEPADPTAGGKRVWLSRSQSIEATYQTIKAIIALMHVGTMVSESIPESRRSDYVRMMTSILDDLGSALRIIGRPWE